MEEGKKCIREIGNVPDVAERSPNFHSNRTLLVKMDFFVRTVTVKNERSRQPQIAKCSKEIGSAQSVAV
jgi:hypothetical protein